jgi:hypothetical protein
MSDREAERVAAGQTEKRLLTDVEKEILRAVSQIEYGSVEVVIHDGEVVQIECREKIRVARDESDRKTAIRQMG